MECVLVARLQCPSATARVESADMATDFLKNMKRNMKRRLKVTSVKPKGMSSTGIKRKLKVKGFGGMKFGTKKGY